MISYQKGWIVEVERAGWTAYKLVWRERQPDGKLKEKSRTMPREIDGKPVLRKHADKELDRITSALNATDGVGGALVVKSSVTFQDLLDKHWVAYVERQKMRQSTIDGYNAMLENWIKPYFGAMILRLITKDSVGDFFTKLRKEKLSDQYQKNMYGLINKIFELAVAFDMLTATPVNAMLHRPSVERGEKQTLPVESIKRFFEELPADSRAPIAILLLTGVRQGEFLGMRWKCMDFDQKLIRKTHIVYRGLLTEGLKQTKKSGKPRKHTVGMSPLVVNLLQHHKSVTSFSGPDDYVFCREDGRPLDPDHLRRYVMYPAMVRAGIPVVKRESGLHMFRHTVVSEVAKRMGLKAAQDQAGHADIGTTANIYTHVDDDQKRMSAGSLETAFAAQMLPSLGVSGEASS